MRACRTIKLLAQTEVCQNDMAVNSNQNIFWLEVTAMGHKSECAFSKRCNAV